MANPYASIIPMDWQSTTPGGLTATAPRAPQAESASSNAGTIIQQWEEIPAEQLFHLVPGMLASLPQSHRDQVHRSSVEKTAEIMQLIIFPLLKRMHVPAEVVREMLQAEFAKAYGPHSSTTTKEPDSNDEGDVDEVDGAESEEVAQNLEMEGVDAMTIEGECDDEAEIEPPRKKPKLKSLKSVAAKQELAPAPERSSSGIVKLKVKGGGSINALTDYYEVQCKKLGVVSKVVRFKYGNLKRCK